MNDTDERYFSGNAWQVNLSNFPGQLIQLSQMNAALKIQSSLNRPHAKHAACAGTIVDVEFTVQYAGYSEVKCILEENTCKVAWRPARKRVKRRVEKSVTPLPLVDN